jgi:hypothetical protein
MLWPRRRPAVQPDALWSAAHSIVSWSPGLTIAGTLSMGRWMTVRVSPTGSTARAGPAITSQASQAPASAGAGRNHLGTGDTPPLADACLGFTPMIITRPRRYKPCHYAPTGRTHPT